MALSSNDEMRKNQLENLEKGKYHFERLTPEEREEVQRKAREGKIEKTKQRKEAKEVLKIFLSLPLKKGKVADIENVKSLMALNGKNITVDQALHLQLVRKALKGDLSAYQTILALIGEKPSDKVDVKVENPYKGLTTEELKKLADEE